MHFLKILTRTQECFYEAVLSISVHLKPRAMLNLGTIINSQTAAINTTPFFSKRKKRNTFQVPQVFLRMQNVSSASPSSFEEVVSRCGASASETFGDLNPPT